MAVHTKAPIDYFPFLNPDTPLKTYEGMASVLRIYLDGPHGIGKTTLGCELTRVLARRTDVVFVPEPMAYWRTAGGVDTIANVYETQRRCDNKEISSEEASLIMTNTQVLMNMPYMVLDQQMEPLLGWGVNHLPPPLPGQTIIVDRHPIASLICYPLARYLRGSFTLQTAMSFLSFLPKIPRGSNLVLGKLSGGKTTQRLYERSRPGEVVDWHMIECIHNIYDRLQNTITYIQQGKNWRDDWHKLVPRSAMDIRYEPVSEIKNPRIHDTLFAVFCAPSLAQPSGRLSNIHASVFDILTERLGSFTMFVLDYDRPVDECLADLLRQSERMTCTVTTKEDLGKLRDVLVTYIQAAAGEQ
ncbi:thymidine kinase [Macropodid alphaherpesvirus 4]|uniref:Thymidine kinase n=1 Tax=Macropodid alphaherpesvirus 4 TaxID=2762721 RepID=A0A7L7YSF0_9ALPH|nr:thymidine kinase [Macropodid alphaherpesvirus 4]QOD40158.1 thymidine kinase [Macropodid alphaherpesvirus 4]